MRSSKFQSADQTTLQEFERIVECVYDAALDQARWPALAEALARYVGGGYGVMHVLNASVAPPKAQTLSTGGLHVVETSTCRVVWGVVVDTEEQHCLERLRSLASHVERAVQINSRLMREQPFAEHPSFPRPHRKGSAAVCDGFTAAFALTKAEAQLLEALVSGQCLGDFARARGLSRHTARNQLTSIFDKTDTRRQLELVTLALRFAGDPGGPSPMSARNTWRSRQDSNLQPSASKADALSN